MATRSEASDVDRVALGLAYHQVSTFSPALRWGLFLGAAVLLLTLYGLVRHLANWDTAPLFCSAWLATALVGTIVGRCLARRTNALMRRCPFYYAYVATYETPNITASQGPWWRLDLVLRQTDSRESLKPWLRILWSPRRDRERKCGIAPSEADVARRLYLNWFAIGTGAGLLLIIPWFFVCFAMPEWLGVEGGARLLAALILLVLPFPAGALGYVWGWRATEGHEAVPATAWDEAHAILRAAGWQYSWYCGWWGGEPFVPTA